MFTTEVGLCLVSGSPIGSKEWVCNCAYLSLSTHMYQTRLGFGLDWITILSIYKSCLGHIKFAGLLQNGQVGQSSGWWRCCPSILGNFVQWFTKSKIHNLFCLVFHIFISAPCHILHIYTSWMLLRWFGRQSSAQVKEARFLLMMVYISTSTTQPPSPCDILLVLEYFGL